MPASLDNLNLSAILSYARITPKTYALMRVLWPEVRQRLRPVLDDFYDHVATDPAMAKMVEGHLDRLKDAQTLHWERLFTRSVDRTYLESVYRIGMAHVKIDLKPHFYLTGYQFLLNRLLKMVREICPEDQLEETTEALVTMVMFDMDMAIWAYLDGLEQQKIEQAKKFERDRDMIANALMALSDGDLTHDIPETNGSSLTQIKKDFNTVTYNLRTLISAIKDTSGTLQDSAASISDSSEDLARRTEQQAAGLEETVAALTEITQTVQQTAENARAAAETADQITSVAEGSEKVVDAAVSTMSQIEKSSREIADITGTIDEIAFMTNLLALNAGVEAARAGEAGRGFAVVATEVRSLAGRSRDAAQNIKKLIQESGHQVEAGVKYVGESGAALKKIIQGVGNINELLSGIASASQQQSTGVSEVNTAMSQMDQVTQKNAAMVDETAASVKALASEIITLNTLVGGFRTER